MSVLGIQRKHINIKLTIQKILYPYIIKYLRKFLKIFHAFKEKQRFDFCFLIFKFNHFYGTNVTLCKRHLSGRDKDVNLRVSEEKYERRAAAAINSCMHCYVSRRAVYLSADHRDEISERNRFPSRSVATARKVAEDEGGRRRE